MDNELKNKLKNAFSLSIDEVKDILNTDLEKGLSSNEVSERQLQYGKNVLVEGKKKSLIGRFFAQLKDFMVIVLILAALLSFVLAIIEQNTTGHGDFADPILILLIVIINAVLGVAQESKAEKAIESIKKMSSPHAKVIRDKKDLLIDVADVVVGDIVVLEAGDYVPADVRIIESHSLKIEESSLTGEAVPVEKTSSTLKNEDIPLGDRLNLAFMSTVVTYGRAKAIVLDTGMNTEIGHIAKMLSDTKEEITPLQKSIAKLGKTLALICLVIVFFIFVIKIATAGIMFGWVTIQSDTWLSAVLTSVSLAVAAIPEGLPAIITIVLSIGMQNLVKKKAIVRTLPAVETLGSTSVICSDKTGTLTQNVMTVTDLFTYLGRVAVSGAKNIDDSLQKLALFGVLCNDTKVSKENDLYLKIGDPTEIALIDLAINLKKDPLNDCSLYPRLFELPFDSNRKLMTTVHDIDGTRYAIVKGAPDVIFLRANSYLENDCLQETTDFSMFTEMNNKLTDDALRVLAIAYKKIDSTIPLEKLTMEFLENDLTILGLVGMIDPPRPEVKDAVSLCKKAGIVTVMITGDHQNTAVAIAKKLGILNNNDISVTGFELDNMSDQEFQDKLQSIKVYARVSPENKVRIVSAWKETGLVVAMTGDGVNDAPSIKKADIGISMGITGTEVAKGAADMILTDDNFATIVSAVEEGRTIFANIKKAIQFLLSCNIGEIFTILVGTIITPFLFLNAYVTRVDILTSVQLLWVNLVTDSLMGIALGMELKERNVMDFPPRDTKKSIFSGGTGKRIFLQGLLLGLISITTYVIGYFICFLGHGNALPLETKYAVAHAEAQMMTFMVLAFSQLFHAFNMRSLHTSIFKLKPNKMLLLAFTASAILQLAVVIIPGLNSAFIGSGQGIGGRAVVSGIEWLVIIFMSILPVIIIELIKLVKNKKRN